MLSESIARGPLQALSSREIFFDARKGCNLSMKGDEVVWEEGLDESGKVTPVQINDVKSGDVSDSGLTALILIITLLGSIDPRSL